MHFRHLRYFVKIVEAGSFSRAAATIHVAQPALSQQIAELEERLGVVLLLRTARGVRPTPAGEALYQEASSILRRIERLPDVVRSVGSETRGTVAVGMSSTLASQFAGRLMEASRAALPGVVLKFTSADSVSLAARLEAQTMDLAAVFESEPEGRVQREAVFRQRLFYVSRQGPAAPHAAVSVRALARLPLVLPSAPNVTRTLLDRSFAALGLRPTVAAEADVLSSLLSAVVQGVGGTVLPRGEAFDGPGGPLATVPIVDPPLYLTASVIWSADVPLTRAGEAVRLLMVRVLRDWVGAHPAPGLEVLGR